MIKAQSMVVAIIGVVSFANEVRADGFDFIATTNHFNTHVRFGKGGILTAWQDCSPPDGKACPSKSTGTYQVEGKCIHYHIDWNMGSYNYPANGSRDRSGNPC
jgi:hypothetical protein